MSFQKVNRGQYFPDTFNVIIEIAANSAPIKYEVNKESDVLFVDRFLSTAMHYPTNYGYIPQTLSDDGDPVDVLVITPYPLQPGVGIACRPLGVFKMTDESGKDAKILAVPVTEVAPMYANLKSYKDVDPYLIEKITHFFTHYKDLEVGKEVKVEGWYGLKEAEEELWKSV